MTRASSHGRPLRDVPHPAGTDPAAGGGKAPGGMWWVAWRQHRAQLAISLGLLVALAELTGGDDSRCTSIEPSSGLSSDYCPEQVYGAVQAEFGTLWGLLRLGMLALPLVLGAFVGAPLFAREIEQHTQVYVLTQSISRMRWWATKVTVVAVPVVLGMIGVGLLMEWAFAPFAAYSYGSMNTPEFETRGIIPAVFTALTIALGVSAGIVLRSTVNALAVTIVVAGMLVVVLGLVRPHLLTRTESSTPSRSATPAQTASTPTPEAGFSIAATSTPAAHRSISPAVAQHLTPGRSARPTTRSTTPGRIACATKASSASTSTTYQRNAERRCNSRSPASARP